MGKEARDKSAGSVPNNSRGNSDGKGSGATLPDFPYVAERGSIRPPLTAGPSFFSEPSPCLPYLERKSQLGAIVTTLMRQHLLN